MKRRKAPVFKHGDIRRSPLLFPLWEDTRWQSGLWEDFNVSTTVGVVQGISHKHCSMLHRADGYSYLSKTGAPLGFEQPSIRAQEVS